MATSFSTSYNQQLTDEARHILRTAGRPMVDDAAKAQDIARAMLNAMEQGDYETARQKAIELKPYWGLLPEGN